MIHVVEIPTITIISAPRKASTSSGNWSVRLRRDYPSGASVEYGRQFWRKAEALAWMRQSGLKSEVRNDV